MKGSVLFSLFAPARLLIRMLVLYGVIKKSHIPGAPG